MSRSPLTNPYMEEDKNSTDKCYLTYSDEIDGGGYLTCAYNHKIGEECLMYAPTNN